MPKYTITGRDADGNQVIEEIQLSETWFVQKTESFGYHVWERLAPLEDTSMMVDYDQMVGLYPAHSPEVPEDVLDMLCDWDTTDTCVVEFDLLTDSCI